MIYLLVFFLVSSCNNNDGSEPEPSDYSPPTGWKMQNEGIPSSETVTAISFIDEENGWIATSTGFDHAYQVYAGPNIYKTNNGGVSWQKVNFNFDTFPRVEEVPHQTLLPSNFGVKDMHFFDGKSGVYCSWDFFTGVTANSGQSFTYFMHDHIGESIKVLNDSSAMVLGYYQSNALVLKTYDQGQTWDTVTLNISSHKQLNALSSTFLYTHDFHLTQNQGVNWVHRPPEGVEKAEAIHFSSANTAYAAYDSMVFTTIDGGMSWDREMLGYGVEHLYFDHKGNGYAIGGNDLLTKPKDNENWAYTEMGDDVHIRDVYESPSGDLWMIGKEGVVFKLDK